MSQILHILSSSNLASSFSRQIGALTVSELQATNPGATVVTRDLVAEPLPHISPEFVGSIFLPDTNVPALELSNKLVDELFASDIIVVESPMYNFSIPSALKAYIDHIVRAGRTFSYGAHGPEGLVKNKKVILVLASGGVYSKGPAAGLEHQASYLQSIFGFLGITDISTIRIEGSASGPEAAEAAVAAAKEQLAAVVHPAA